MKTNLMLVALALAGQAVVAEPNVVRRAAAREAARQDGTWTSENIRANPYLFL